MKEKHQRVGDLEIIQDLEFQRRTWIAERIVWIIFALILLLALIGLFGQGPLSHTVAGKQGEYWAEYDRFIHYESPTLLRVHARSLKDNRLKVLFDHAYISQIQLEEIIPQPETAESSEEGVSYVFLTPNPGEMATMTFHLRPLAIGRLSGLLAIPHQGQLRIRQFVFP